MPANCENVSQLLNDNKVTKCSRNALDLSINVCHIAGKMSRRGRRKRTETVQSSCLTDFFPGSDTSASLSEIVDSILQDVTPDAIGVVQPKSVAKGIISDILNSSDYHKTKPGPKKRHRGRLNVNGLAAWHQCFTCP